MDVRGKVKTHDGTAGAPGHSFYLDDDSGLWRPGTNRVGIATGGTARWEVDDSGHLIPAADNTYNLGASAASIKDLWVDGTFNGAGVTAVTYNPNFSALTTNPTLGTGGTQTGYYVVMGKRITAWVSVKFGTSGTNAGSGQYRIDLPFNSDLSAHPVRGTIGAGRLRCAGQDYTAVCSAVQVGGVGTQANILVNGSPGVVAAFNQPGAWTANDELFFHLDYLAA